MKRNLYCPNRYFLLFIHAAVFILLNQQMNAQWCSNASTLENKGTITPTTTRQTSNGGTPSTSGNGQRFYWSFAATAGNIYTFDLCNVGGGFTSFRIYIYDGPSTTGNQAGISGTTSDCNSHGKIVWSAPNSQTYYILVTYSSCGPLSATPVILGYMYSAPTETTCSGTFYDSGGAGSNYNRGENWTKTFYPSTPNNAIRMQFTSFTLQNNANGTDYLYIYDGNSTAALPIAGSPFTGSNSPGTITSSAPDGSLTFRFVSNISALALPTAGWAATISCVANCVDPDIIGQPANLTACENETVTFSVATTGTGLTYQWRKGTANLSNSGNITGVTTSMLSITNISLADASTDYNVVVSGQCGTPVTSQNASLTVNVLPATPNPTITSNSPNCNSVDISHSGTPPVSETWYWQTSQSGTDIAHSGATYNVTQNGTYFIRARNNTTLCWSSGHATSPAVTVLTVPAQPGNFTIRQAVVCVGDENVSYEVPAVGGATIYNWTYSGSGAIIFGGLNSVTIDFSMSATSGTLSVTAENACGISLARTMTIVVTQLPDQPSGFIASQPNVCQNESGVVYTVSPVSGATSYNWSFDGTNATINGNGNSVTVDFGATATSGTLSVAAVNSCGAGTELTFAVTVTNLPAQPASFVQSQQDVCQGENGVTYAVTLVSGATSYAWSYSGNGITLNGTTEFITADFDVTATNGTLSVSAVNSCGASAPQNFYVNVEPLPAQPGAFTVGQADVCRGESGVAYEVAVVSGATTYIWDYSGSGATINGTTNNVTVDFDVNAVSGSLNVWAQNICGMSQPQTYAVTVNEAPMQPGGFTLSQTNVCQNTNGVDYVVTAVSDATSYVWSYNGSGVTINGTSNSATVDYGANATAGLLSVAAENNCGTSNYLTLPITIDDLPAQPATFTISDNNVCLGETGVAYEVPVVSGATSYVWSYSGSGATINGTTNSVTVDFDANATGGVLSVAAVNACGTGTAQIVSVTANAKPNVTLNAFNTLCNTDGAVTLSGGSPAGGTYFVDGTSSATFDPSVAGAGTYTITYEYTNAGGCSGTATETLTVDVCSGINNIVSTGVILYPNPASEYFMIHSSENSRIQIFDAVGKICFDMKSVNRLTKVDARHFENGMYFVKIVSNYNIITQKKISIVK